MECENACDNIPSILQFLVPLCKRVCRTVSIEDLTTRRTASLVEEDDNIICLSLRARIQHITLNSGRFMSKRNMNIVRTCLYDLGYQAPYPKSYSEAKLHWYYSSWIPSVWMERFKLLSASGVIQFPLGSLCLRKRVTWRRGQDLSM